MTEPHPRWRRILADLLIRYRYALMIGGIALIALAYGPSKQLKLDQTIESLYDPSDPYLQDYLESKSLFGGDEFVIVAYHDPQLLEPEGLSRVRKISEELSQIEGVNQASTQDLARVKDSMQQIVRDMLPTGLKWAARGLASLREAEVSSLVEGVLIGQDQETTGIVLRLLPEDATPAPRGDTIDTIRAVALQMVREETGDESRAVYVVGEPVQVHDMFAIVQADGTRLFYWSLVLLGGVILVLFRNFRWVALPLVVVAASIVWTNAVLVWSGMRLSMVSSMLNSIVTVIGIAEVMHVTVYFRENRKRHDRVESMRHTLIDLMPVMFWTVVTTAAGFISLPMVSQIAPVSSFGTMMSIGSMMVILAAALFIPGGPLIGNIHVDPAEPPIEEKLVRVLGRTTEWVQKRSILVSMAAALLTAFAAIGFTNLEVETDFSRNFRESSPIVTSLNFVESHLGGAGTWEVNFPAPKELTPAFLTQVENVAKELRAMNLDGEPQLTKVVSITDILDLVGGGTNSPEEIRTKLNRIARFQPEYEQGLYHAGQERMRLVLRSRERQPAQIKLALIENVRETVDEEFGAGTAKTTGMFVLLAYIIESLLRDQFLSFLLTTLMMWGMMTVAFRSWRVGLVSMAPNIFPIVVLIGGMGWLRLPINIGTAMIASVSMGLTIDSSIHYVAGYRRARKRMHGGDALRQTHEDVGRALVFTTFALMVGFSVLMLSNFVPLVYFGVLVSAAMLGGLIGNLTFFPLLLRWAEPEPAERTLKVKEKTAEPAIVAAAQQISAPSAETENSLGTVSNPVPGASAKPREAPDRQ